jgi:DMSO/TMAO reductase YedYZ molybdopterin-dependent catalytic subunit
VAPRLSLAVGLLAIALALVLALTRSDERRSGTDLTPNGVFAVALRPGQVACQAGELTPADTAALRMTIGTYGAAGQPLSVSLKGPRGALVTDGRLGAGWTQGVVRIPVREVRAASDQNRFCIRNEASNNIAIAGDRPDPGYDLTLDGHTIHDVRMRVDYMRPGRETWASLAPVVAHRFSLAKASWLRHWAWAAYLVLALAAVAVAAALLLARERRA